MGDKIKQFLANHFEKLLLPIFGLLIIWLLLTKVIISPNRVDMGGEKYDPWGIDTVISRQAEDIKAALDSDPEPKPPYKAKSPELAALYGTGLDIAIASQQKTTMPSYIPQDQAVGGEYVLPDMGSLTDVAAMNIRAAAYLPTERITAQNTYLNVQTEPNDLDFVTVQATYDVAELVKRFRESFIGMDVKLEWRDESLAKPVFGAVRLERQELIDGIWGPWTQVPRAEIDHMAQMFSIEEDAAKLPPGGLKVLMLQFDETHVQSQLLQPTAYQIASAREEWFPPRMHARYAGIRDDELQQELREMQEQEREQLLQLREQRSGGGAYSEYGGTGSRTGSRRTSGSRTSGGRTSSGRTGRSTTTRRTNTTTNRRTTTASPYGATGSRLNVGRANQNTISAVYQDYEALLIPDTTEVTDLIDPLVIWAFDDTVRPGSTYRYRMKLGAFNPIAGSNKFKDKNSPLKNSVFLWTDYTQVTEPIHIPQMFYLFATNFQEASKIVGVEVAKYQMGYWRSENFQVCPGESIGAVVEQEKEDPRERMKRLGMDIQGSSIAGYGYGGVPTNDPTKPDEIDFTTGAVLVDIGKVSDWAIGRSIRTVEYPEMLYSFGGAEIEHMPIGSTNWPSDLQVAKADIANLQKTPIEPLRDRDSRGGRRSRTGGRGGMDSEYYEEMMMEDMYGDMLYNR